MGLLVSLCLSLLVFFILLSIWDLNEPDSAHVWGISPAVFCYCRCVSLDQGWRRTAGPPESPEPLVRLQSSSPEPSSSGCSSAGCPGWSQSPSSSVPRSPPPPAGGVHKPDCECWKRGSSWREQLTAPPGSPASAAHSSLSDLSFPSRSSPPYDGTSVTHKHVR